MRRMCPNDDSKNDGMFKLETVLEVPLPEEIFIDPPTDSGGRRWRLSKTNHRWASQPSLKINPPTQVRNTDLPLLLTVISTPLIPCSTVLTPTTSSFITNKQSDMEKLQAKYIMRQYIAATGGDKMTGSMYAMGKVSMKISEMDGVILTSEGIGRVMGGFVLWKKSPDLWCIELMICGYKISAGSDGNVVWRQTPWCLPHSTRGPPRSLRRSIQGIDPWLTANMFANAACIGNTMINKEECFILKIDSEPSGPCARRGSNVEILEHTVWGYFSHRSGLLVQLNDTHVLKNIEGGSSDIGGSNSGSSKWITNFQSTIEDYRNIDGVYIAHSGRSSASLQMLGDSTVRTTMEENWEIVEVDFDVRGLSMDCFLPPSDLKKPEKEDVGLFSANCSSNFSYGQFPSQQGLNHRKSSLAGFRIGSSKSKAAAVEVKNIPKNIYINI